MGGFDYLALPPSSRSVVRVSDTLSTQQKVRLGSGLAVFGVLAVLCIVGVSSTIHGCAERGIYGNGFGDLGLFLVLFDNDVSSTGSDSVWVDSAIALDETDPGENPHEPQDWYCH